MTVNVVGKSFVQQSQLEFFLPDQQFFEIPIPHPTHKDDWLAQYNPITQDFADWKTLMYTPLKGRTMWD